MLTDRNGGGMSHGPIFHDTRLRVFDAICSYAEITIRDDELINGSSTNKDTTVYYCSQISMQLDNITGIAYYNFSLGRVELYEDGIYCLIFVTPYEAKVGLSDNINVLPYERSNCAGSGSDMSIPYFDVVFNVDQ